MVEVSLFLTGTELEHAQWKGPIQWAHLWARTYLQYLLVISGNKQKKIWKVLKKIR